MRKQSLGYTPACWRGVHKKGGLRLVMKFSQYLCKLLFFKFVFCKSKHIFIEFSVWIRNIDSIQFKKNQGGCKRCPLIPIKEWMIIANVKGIRGSHLVDVVLEKFTMK